MRRVASLALSTTLGGLALIAPGDRARAQEPGLGTIRGTVYDSLLGSPLGGAQVELLGGSRSTVSDEHGRFTLDSVPAGRRVVTFSRPDLDLIGLSSLAAPVTVMPGGVVALPLAVPSHATFWRAACGAASRRRGSDSGLVFGTVTDARTGARLRGARVTVSWVAVTHAGRRRWVVAYPAREITTDSLGVYYACGVPVEYLFAAGAQAGPFASGTAEAVVDFRGIARRDLSVSLEEIPGGADSSGRGARRGLATVVGTVRGERGGRLPGSLASVDDAEGSAEADEAGRFVLRDLPAGTQMLMVRRVGYFAWRQPVDLRNRDTLRVEATLEEATVLDTIRVTAAPQMAAVLEEIDLRRRAGFGYFFSLAEIRRRPRVLSVFEGIPSVAVRGSPWNFTLWARSPLHMASGPSRQGEGLTGYCRLNVFIDGWPADEEQLASMTLRQLIAVEVYPRPSIFLGRYAAGINNCGVALVWTALAH
jgi:hypothetical protein